MSIPFFNYDDIPSEILNAAENGTLVFFIGAGISQLAGLPSWQGFAHSAIKSLTPSLSHLEEKQLLEIGDNKKLLSIATMLADGKDNIEWSKILDEDNSDSDIYTYLNNISATKVTTNYDSLLKPCDFSTADLINEKKRYYKSSDINPSLLKETGSIIHLHGSVLESSTMIISTEDYFEHYEQTNIQDFLSELFNYTVVFLGYGLSETEILQFIFSNTKRELKDDNERRRFFLNGFYSYEVSLYKIQEKYYREKYGVHILPFNLDDKSYKEQIPLLEKWASNISVNQTLVVDDIKEIEDLSKRKNITSDQMRRLLYRVREKRELKRYFVKFIKDISWFNVLEELGFFRPVENPDKTEGDQEGYFSIPHWYSVDYLINISPLLILRENGDIAQKCMEIIREVTVYSKENNIENWRTWWQFSQILNHMPAECIIEDDIRLFEHWLDDRFNNSHQGTELGKFALKLINDTTQKDFGMKIIERLLYVKDVSYYRWDRYTLEKFFENARSFFVSDVGKQVINILSNNICLLTNDELKSKSSHLREKISKADSRYSDHKPYDQTIDFILQTFTTLNTSDKIKIIDEYTKNTFSIFKRIALYFLTITDIDLSQFDGFLSSLNINDNEYKIEFWDLIKDRYLHMSKGLQANILRQIDDFKYIDSDSTIDERTSKYIQRIWYSALKSHANTFNEKFIALCDELELPVEDVDFLPVFQSGFVVPSSPVTRKEILSMSLVDIVDFLNNFVDDEKDFLTDKKKGLSNEFCSLLKMNIIEYLSNTGTLAKLDFYYQSDVLRSITELWNEEAHLPWDELWIYILKYCELIVSNEKIWLDQDTEFYKHSTISNIADLIQAGVKTDKHAFTENRIPKALEIISLIIRRQSHADFSKRSDVMSISINDARGNALEALVLIALRMARIEEKDNSDHSSSWGKVLPIFNELICDSNDYGVYTVLARFYPNMSWLNTQWSIENILPMFLSSDEIMYKCMVQGYSYVNYFYKDVYLFFRENDIILKILKNKSFSKSVRAKYLQFQLLAYVNYDETIESLSRILDQLPLFEDNEILSAITQFFFISRENRENINPKMKTKCIQLWTEIISNSKNTEPSFLLSELSSLIWYIDELSEENISLITKTTNFEKWSTYSYDVLEFLAYKSREFPMQVKTIWHSITEKFNMDYPTESLELMMQNLYDCDDVQNRDIEVIISLYISKYGNDKPSEIWKTISKNS